MISPQWEVQPATGRCAVSGRVLGEGEEFYTVLFEEGESFRRADYSSQAWQGPPPGSFCHFRSRVPVREKRKRLLVDNEVLTTFFRRLADDPEPARIQFRFVIALILMRKRLLRYEGSVTRDGVDTWTMTLLPEKSEHRVIHPRLTDAQIEGVSEQLSAILHGDMGAWAQVASAEPSADEADGGA